MAIDYNNAATWVCDEIHNLPTGVDVAAYQSKIDRICGLTPMGKPTVKLTWIPDAENWSHYYCEWDSAGYGTKTHIRAQYVFHTFWEGNAPLDVPPPRWALKQWQDGSQYAMSDEQSRWQRAEKGFKTETTETGTVQVAQQTFSRELRPPRPTEGRYIPLPLGVIAKHNGWCCKEAKRHGQTCWGRYRKPDNAYLKLLANAVKIRETEVNGQNPNEPISVETLRQAAEEAVKTSEEKTEMVDAHLDKLLDNYLNEIVAYYTGDESFKEVGKAYSVPSGFKETRSGLIVPN